MNFVKKWSISLVGILSIAMLTFSPAPSVYAAEGVTAWCGNGCSTSEDGDPRCTDWSAASPGASCQAKAICSGDRCTSWVVELDLPNPGSVYLTGNWFDPEPTPIARTFVVLSETNMQERLRPGRIRRTYRQSPPDDGRYKNVYVANNFTLWQMCEIDANGNDLVCDVYQPWP